MVSFDCKNCWLAWKGCMLSWYWQEHFSKIRHRVFAKGCERICWYGSWKNGAHLKRLRYLRKSLLGITLSIKLSTQTSMIIKADFIMNFKTSSTKGCRWLQSIQLPKSWWGFYLPLICLIDPNTGGKNRPFTVKRFVWWTETKLLSIASTICWKGAFSRYGCGTTNV